MLKDIRSCFSQRERSTVWLPLDCVFSYSSEVRRLIDVCKLSVGNCEWMQFSNKTSKQTINKTNNKQQLLEYVFTFLISVATVKYTAVLIYGSIK